MNWEAKSTLLRQLESLSIYDKSAPSDETDLFVIAAAEYFNDSSMEAVGTLEEAIRLSMLAGIDEGALTSLVDQRENLGDISAIDADHLILQIELIAGEMDH